MPRSTARAATTQGDLSTLKGSPPQRRWTRSQSREIEAQQYMVPAGQSSPEGRKKGWKNKGRNGLGVVVEESPMKSSIKSGFRASQVIPESPEDAHNISMSGTTILEPEFDPESEDALDPELMLEALPDLERVAMNVLDFLLQDSADQASMLSMVKRLADPRNTQSKRLTRSKMKLKEEARNFGGKTYIDVLQTSNLISSRLASKDGVEPNWSPEPILHRANCARFALEVLLASGDSTNQAIRNLESLFPLPFMNDLVRDGQRGTVGKSALERDTFALALEIRTRSLIMQLEEHQNSHDFDPHAILQDGFFLIASSGEDLESSDGPLRGFNPDKLGGADGYLPDPFKDTAYSRFEDMRDTLLEHEDGIEVLKRYFSWQKFLSRASQWVRKRCEEINQNLKRQQSAEDMREKFFAEPKKDRHSLSSVAARSEFTPRRTEERSERGTVAPVDSRRDSAIPSETQREIPTVVEPKERRKSGKPFFLNEASIERMKQRRARRQSDVVVRPGSQTVPEESQLRRQTLPAPRQARPSSPEETTEVPASRDASPTLLHDEPEFTLDDESELFVGERSQLEKSRSPVMVRNSREPRHETVSPVRSRLFASQLRRETTSTQASNASRLIPSSLDLWKAAMADGSPGPSRKRQRSDRAAFIDRQTNAHRVSPISHGNDRSVERRRNERPSKKRRRSESEDQDEDESDEEFSNYNRSVDIARKRAEKPKQPQSKRQKVRENEDESAAQLQDGLEETTRSTAVPESPDAASKSKSPAPVPVSSSARHTVTSTKAQMRWTPSEDARLIRLIEETDLGGPKGSGWCKIAQKNEAQSVLKGESRIEGRGQVQLKDRARNLKIKFLREQKPLPRHFKYVTMKEKDVAMLLKRGIDVSRASREQNDE
ncbi:hypothetical protein BDV23DRAFT_145408 [Aspergillus alliaceus]|uniref:Myb-like domain-containing protein n=1 Tax=Petromyces alliaceus TaxID=209559 RepID=A0A5N7CLV4_PETAA|nr:hypothetical protein BDV23DRAFT_145408 [Aspergillus alliaceus]